MGSSWAARAGCFNPSLNVGHTAGKDLAAEANHERICQTLGITPTAIATAHQAHGSAWPW